MYKKTLLSLAVASSLALTGCFESSTDSSSAGAGSPSATDTWPRFNPVQGALPLPNDLLFDSEAEDGSFGVDDTQPPVTTALNDLSGASTIAPAVVRFNGKIDEDSVDSRAFIENPDPDAQAPVIPNPNQNVFLIELGYASGAPVRGLSGQEPPTVPLAITTQVALGQDPLGNGRDLDGRDQADATHFWWIWSKHRVLITMS